MYPQRLLKYIIMCIIIHIVFIFKPTNMATIKKQMTFPAKLVELVEEKGGEFGLKFNEYVRHVLITDIQKESESIPYVDKETEESVGRGLEDLRKSRVVRVNNKKELKEFLDKISED